MAEYMTRDQLAEWLQVTRQYLENLASRRQGPPYVRLGSRMVRYDRAAVIAWIAESSAAAA